MKKFPQNPLQTYYTAHWVNRIGVFFLNPFLKILQQSPETSVADVSFEPFSKGDFQANANQLRGFLMKPKGTIFGYFVKYYFREYLAFTVFQFLDLLLKISRHVTLFFLMSALQNSQNRKSVLMYSVLFCASVFLRSFFFGHIKTVAARLSNEVSATMVSLLFQSVLQSAQPLTVKQTNQTLELVSNELDDCETLVLALNHPIFAFLEFVFETMFFIWYTGWQYVKCTYFVLAFVLGLLAVLLLFYLPCNREIARERSENSDVIIDSLQGILLIKLMGWEDSFWRLINKRMRKYFLLLNRNAILSSLFLGLFTTSTVVVRPLLELFFNLSISSVVDHSFHLGLFSMLNECLLEVPKSYIMFSKFLGVTRKFTKLVRSLCWNESPQSLPQPESAENAIESADAVLARDSSFSLQLGSLSVRSGGELVAVIGANGSGKSTLLLSLLRGVALSSGKLRVLASAAYAPQQPWIVSGSVRENVLLGRPHDRDRYRLALALCCLEQDLQSWPQGDRSQVGENGALLSGGQRARLSMARALYGEADLYLLDDIFSALDGRIQQQIAANLRSHVRSVGKTAVVTTNQFNLLPLFSQILLLDGGRLVFNGSYEEFQNSSFFAPTTGRLETEHDPSTLKSSESFDLGPPSPILAPQSVDDSFVDDYQAIKRKSISCRPRKTFFIADLYRFLRCGGFGFFIVPIFLLGAVYYPIVILMRNITDYFNGIGYPKLGNILGISLSMSVATFKLFFLMYAIINSTQKVFASGTLALLHAKFNVILDRSRGSIISVFTKDINVIVSQLTENLIIGSEYIWLGISVYCYNIYHIPIALLYFPIIAVCVRSLAINFTRITAAMKNDSSKFHGSIISEFDQTTPGIRVIRCIGADSFFTKKLEEYIRLRFLANDIENCARQWLAIRIDTIFVGHMIVILVFLLDGHQISYTELGKMLFSLANLLAIARHTISSVLSIPVTLSSSGRLVSFTKLPQEETAGEPPPKVSPCWPETGHLELVQVSATLPGTDRLILSGISLSIRPRERIAVIGRTGAGKSSLLNALLRIIDVEGRILLDGVDISSVPIRLLRQRIAIVPQEPYLFAQPIRFNLDPEGTHSDEQLWEVLRRVDLRRKVAAFPDALDASVSKELTESDRQLVSLGRVLLKQPRVVIFDEASAKLDPETGRRVMRLAEEALSGSVLISILHRVETALHYDRIVVMEQGRVVECDAPYTLLCNPQSIFTALLHAKSDSARVFERWFQEAKRAFEEKPAGQ